MLAGYLPSFQGLGGTVLGAFGTGDLGPPHPGLRVLQPVGLSLGLDDLTPVGKAIKSRSGETLGTEHLGLGLERQVRRDDQACAFVRGGDDVEEQLCPDL